MLNDLITSALIYSTGRGQHAMSVRVEGTRWRCTGAECARGGDTLELVSRGLHGTVYFRLTPAQKQGVRRWCVDFLGGAL